MPTGFDEFIALFKKCGLDLQPSQLELFWSFHQHLRKRNLEADLTRIRRFEDLVVKHYVDSALVPTLLSLVSPVLDIGTGAGFPGIPIKSGLFYFSSNCCEPISFQLARRFIPPSHEHSRKHFPIISYARISLLFRVVFST